MKFKKNNFKFFFVLLFVLTAIQSCTLFEPASPVASYIHIDSVSLQTNYQTEGSNSSKITDAWVFYDNIYLGTFPLPADIPLIGEGLHSITVKAGILVNGISASRSAYPKYTSFDTTLLLSSKEKTFFSPTIAYKSSNSFPQIEDFDDASLSLVATTTGTVPIVITQLADPNSLEGNSGIATLDQSHTVFEVASSGAFALPLNAPSFLELNYKGENDFTVGVFITASSGIVKSDLLSIRASSTWKKIYVSLSDLGGVVTDGINYKIYLHAELNPLLTTANIYFDNLKVVF